MQLDRIAGWNTRSASTACGAGDKPKAACGASCSGSCGAGDKPKTACGSACGSTDK